MATEIDALRGFALVNLAFASALAAVIWFVQRVHYPLYRAIPPSAFASYFRAHLRSARRMLAAPILCEAVAALGLAWLSTGSVRAIAWLSLALLFIGLLITAGPIERRYRALAQGFDHRELDALLRWNRLRAFAWTARSALALIALALSH